MKWIDLFQFLNERANDYKNLGKFDWQNEIKVFDMNIGEYYNAELIQFNGENSISISIDTDIEGSNNNE